MRATARISRIPSISTAGQLIGQQIGAGIISGRELAKRINKDHESIRRYVRGEVLVPVSIAERLGNEIFSGVTEKVQSFVELCKEESGTKDGRRRQQVLVRRSVRYIKKRYFAVADINVSVDRKAILMDDPFNRDKLVVVPQEHKLILKGSIELVDKTVPQTYCQLSSDGDFIIEGNLNLNIKLNSDSLKTREALHAFSGDCGERGIPIAGLIDILREEAIASSTLNPDRYMREKNILFPHSLINFLSGALVEASDILSSATSSSKEKTLALAELKVVSEQLRIYDQYPQEQLKVREQLLSQIDLLAKRLRSLKG